MIGRLLVALATASALVTAPVPAEAARAAAACPPAIQAENAQHWAGGSGSWSDISKWSGGFVPGVGAGARVAVCIPPGSDVVIDATTPRIDLSLLDLARGSHLTLEPETALYLWFNPLYQRSVIRPDAVLELDGATFGGHHRMRVMGTFLAHRSIGGSPAILTSKPVGATGTARPGLLEIGDHGLFDITGNGSVHLKKRYVVDVRGMARLRDDAGLVAGYGTSLLLQRRFHSPGVGRLVIRNDHGFVGGSDDDTRHWATFVNRGAIIKKDSTGTSRVIARYFEERGRVTALTGTVITSDPILTPPATDTCNETTCNQRQEASLKVPVTDPDGSGVEIATLPGAKPSNIARYVGVPMKVHATDLDATAADPAIIRFRYANSLFAEAGIPADPSKLDVAHANSPDKPYFDIPDCVGRGLQTGPSCLDRKASTKVSGGVLLVVRTVDTSRWVVH